MEIHENNSCIKYFILPDDAHLWITITINWVSKKQWIEIRNEIISKIWWQQLRLNVKKKKCEEDFKKKIQISKIKIQKESLKKRKKSHSEYEIILLGF